MSEEDHGREPSEEPTQVVGSAERRAEGENGRQGGDTLHASVPPTADAARAADQAVREDRVSAVLRELSSDDSGTRMDAARKLVRLCASGQALSGDVIPALQDAYRREPDMQAATALLAAVNRLKRPASGGGPAPQELDRVPHASKGRDTQVSDDWTSLQALPPAALEDRYRIEGLIAATRMSEVYRGWRLSDGMQVAIKCLPCRLAGPSAHRQFTRETEVLISLRHPHIVSVLDRGVAEEVPYFVMEYVEGGDLRDLLAQPRPPLERVLRIGAEVCEALAYIHANGVVHLDMKPGNVLLDVVDRAKLTDFGIARAISDTAAGPTVAVTPRYAAPERFTPKGQPDHRSDIYSLGVVLYQVLTGILPQEDSGGLSSPSKARVSGRVERALRKALQPDPEQRFANAEAFRGALLDCLPSYMRGT